MCWFLKIWLFKKKKKFNVFIWNQMMWFELWMKNNNNTDEGQHYTLVLVFHSKSRDTKHCLKPEHPRYKTAWAQTLSLVAERETYVLIRFGQRASVLGSQNQGQAIPPASSFKSTSPQHPSAETMIASLIFGNSLNLSNPWFWNISTAAARRPKLTKTYIFF